MAVYFCVLSVINGVRMEETAHYMGQQKSGQRIKSEIIIYYVGGVWWISSSSN